MKNPGSALITLLSALFLISYVIAQGDTEEQFTGLIAYIGSDYNVYTIDPRLDNPLEITADAGQTRRYQWPTWSNDGRLAYFSSFLDNNNLYMGAYISVDGRDTGEEAYIGRDEIFQYAYWSPENCVSDENCRNLSLLLSSRARGLLVEMINDTVQGSSHKTVGTGAPFYQSWSPDGTRMLWQRNQQVFELYDVDRETIIETLPQAPGFIQAPSWSPVDDRLLIGALNPDGQSTDLLVVDHNEVLTLATGLNGLISYNWSPDGSLIAYRAQTGMNTYGPLLVVNAINGETIARSPVTGVLSFFWSPDGTRIAYITLMTPPGSFSAQAEQVGGAHLSAPPMQPGGLTWSVMHVWNNEINRYGSFLPTQEMLYLLQYFDQFNQSHRIWSPDSKHLVYAEITPDGPVVNLLDTNRTDSVPFSIATGLIGIWSFN